MPTYEYRCSDCNFEFEKQLRMADNTAPELEPCPGCNQVKIKQFVSQMNLGDPVRMGVAKVPSDFNKYVLDRIRTGHPRHTMGNPKAPNNIKEI